MIDCIIKYNNYIVLLIYIKPNAKNNAFLGVTEKGLNIAIKAKPVDGEANKALVRFLSKILDIPQKHIEILSGEKSRKKRVKINTDCDIDKLMNKFL